MKKIVFILLISLLIGLAGCDEYFSPITYQIRAYLQPATITDFATGLPDPQGMALDAQGNLLVLNTVSGIVKRVDANGTIHDFATGGRYSAWIAVGPTGDVFTTCYGDSTVKKVGPSGGVMTTYVRGLVNPSGMAFDSAGNLYVSEYDTRTILRVAPDGSQTVFAVLPIGPTGLTFDKAGRLYASHLYRNSITRISHDGTQRELFASGVPSPHTLAFDAHGNLFVSESNVDSRTISVVASDGFIYQFSNAFIWPTGLVFDSSGTLYVANYGSGEISRVKILYPK